MNPSLKDTQKYLMKKIDKYTTKIHYIMLILDIISQIIEQEEPFGQKHLNHQPMKLKQALLHM